MRRLYPTDLAQCKMANAFVGAWMFYVMFDPETALRKMLPRVEVEEDEKEMSVRDVLRLVAVTRRTPGWKFIKPIPKDLWLKFYQSPNLCYRILALEKYDSTTQTPEELLSLHRLCLMKGFNYLQVRALEGIYQNQDYRPETKQLIEEYLASKPKKNDGTNPPFGRLMRNPIDGCAAVLGDMDTDPQKRSRR